MNHNAEILDQIISRDISNIYENLRTTIINSIPKQFQGIAINYIKANEKKWENAINEKIELIVAMSFPDELTTLEEGMENANFMVNDFINNWLTKNIGIPENVVQIGTQLLFGVR